MKGEWMAIQRLTDIGCRLGINLCAKQLLTRLSIDSRECNRIVERTGCTHPDGDSGLGFEEPVKECMDTFLMPRMNILHLICHKDLVDNR